MRRSSGNDFIQSLLAAAPPVARIAALTASAQSRGRRPLQELVSTAVVGELSAAARHDPAQAAYATFAGKRARGAIADENRSEQRFQRRFVAGLGHDGATLHRRGVGDDDDDASTAIPLDLDPEQARSGVSQGVLADASGEEEWARVRDSIRVTVILIDAVAALPDAQFDILRAYFFKKMTFEQIGEQLGVDRRKVAGEMGRAFTQLRRRFADEGFDHCPRCITHLVGRVFAEDEEDDAQGDEGAEPPSAPRHAA